MLCTGSCAPLLIQQRYHISGFERSWNEYKRGFGDTNSNYWIGNDMLSWLTTNDNYTLRFDLQARSTGKWFYAEYSTFVVLPEAQNYKLQVAGFSGNAGGDALGYSNDMMFSTYDRDNDHDSGSCAKRWGGGFWYKMCSLCDVNDIIMRWYKGTFADNWKLQASRMWLQCK